MHVFGIHIALSLHPQCRCRFYVSTTVSFLRMMRVDDHDVSTHDASLQHGPRGKLILRVDDRAVSVHDASLHHGTRVSAQRTPCQSGIRP